MRRMPGAAVLAAVAGIGVLSGCSTDPTAAMSKASVSTETSMTGATSATSTRVTPSNVAGVRCGAAPTARANTPTRALPDKKTAAGKMFTATIHTNCGPITVQLYGAKAPQTVASFVALATAYYTATPCPRVVTSGIYVLQCGDPTGTGGGSPGYQFGVENAPADGRYPTGTLAMARGTDPDTNGGQFFIVYQDSVIQDPVGYSIFGRVTSGLDILRAVAARGDDGSNPAGGGVPLQPIGILKITVTEQKA